MVIPDRSANNTFNNQVLAHARRSVGSTGLGPICRNDGAHGNVAFWRHRLPEDTVGPTVPPDIVIVGWGGQCSGLKLSYDNHDLLIGGGVTIQMHEIAKLEPAAAGGHVRLPKAHS